MLGETAHLHLFYMAPSLVQVSTTKPLKRCNCPVSALLALCPARDEAPHFSGPQDAVDHPYIKKISSNYVNMRKLSPQRKETPSINDHSKPSMFPAFNSTLTSSCEWHKKIQKGKGPPLPKRRRSPESLQRNSSPSGWTSAAMAARNWRDFNKKWWVNRQPTHGKTGGTNKEFND